MISIHWSWLVFVPVVILLLICIAWDRGDFDLLGGLLFFVLVAYILIWGGIFWW